MVPTTLQLWPIRIQNYWPNIFSLSHYYGNSHRSLLAVLVVLLMATPSLLILPLRLKWRQGNAVQEQAPLPWFSTGITSDTVAVDD